MLCLVGWLCCVVDVFNMVLWVSFLFLFGVLLFIVLVVELDWLFVVGYGELDYVLLFVFMLVFVLCLGFI